jgi:hypothetical protein
MILSLFFACAAGSDSAEPEDSGVAVGDHRVNEADLGELDDNQIVFEGAEFTVQPGQDVMMCLFGTYTGETIGLHDVHTFQGAGGHHLQMMGTSTPAIDVPDGTVADCTSVGGVFNMADLEPIGITNGGSVDGKEIDISMPLPDGMAFELESGQRFVMQSHYLNTTQDTFKVRDLAVLTLMPEEEVTTWAAPLIFNDSNFAIPAGSAGESSFDCTTDEDWNFLYVLGHMHEWGTAFNVDRVAEDGSTESFYSIPEWDPVYRDAPLIDYYPDAAMPVPKGSTFRTTCDWFNDTDTEMTFPYEMCVNVNIVYPQKATVVCDAE